MAFWNKKRSMDALMKYLNEQKISYKEEMDCITFELFFKNCGYTLYPYSKINELTEELSIIINVKKIEDRSVKQLAKLNSFNLKSKYFAAKISEENILYLEYNARISYEFVGKCVEQVIESLFNLEEDIDNL